MIPRRRRRNSLFSACEFSRLSSANCAGVLRLRSGPEGAARLPKRAAELHNQTMFDWNDLRYYLAVVRHGSTIAAGKAVGLSQSTVHRRLDELERRIGRKLMARDTSGYRLTEFGRELLPYAQQIEAAIEELQRYVNDTARDQAGVIRVTCPEPIVRRMMPLIERFHARHPKLRVEFVMSDRYLDLLKGDADVAFRSGDTDDELVGRKIADFDLGHLCQPRIYRASRQAGARRRPVASSTGDARRIVEQPSRREVGQGHAAQRNSVGAQQQRSRPRLCGEIRCWRGPSPDCNCRRRTGSGAPFGADPRTGAKLASADASRTSGGRPAYQRSSILSSKRERASSRSWADSRHGTHAK